MRIKRITSNAHSTSCPMWAITELSPMNSIDRSTRQKEHGRNEDEQGAGVEHKYNNNDKVHRVPCPKLLYTNVSNALATSRLSTSNTLLCKRTPNTSSKWALRFQIQRIRSQTAERWHRLTCTLFNVALNATRWFLHRPKHRIRAHTLSCRSLPPKRDNGWRRSHLPINASKPKQ